MAGYRGAHRSPGRTPPEGPTAAVEAAADRLHRSGKESVMTTVVDPDPSRIPAVAVGSTAGPARGPSVVKPSAFAPSVHFHAASDAMDLATALRDALGLLVDSGRL